MARTFRLHVFCYDIASDAVRARVARRLEDFGLRVQKSVFEVKASRTKVRSVAAAISRELAPGDSLRVYPLTDTSLAAIDVRGSGLRPERSEFYLM